MICQTIFTHNTTARRLLCNSQMLYIHLCWVEFEQICYTITSYFFSPFGYHLWLLFLPPPPLSSFFLYNMYNSSALLQFPWIDFNRSVQFHYECILFVKSKKIVIRLNLSQRMGKPRNYKIIQIEKGENKLAVIQSMYWLPLECNDLFKYSIQSAYIALFGVRPEARPQHVLSINLWLCFRIFHHCYFLCYYHRLTPSRIICNCSKRLTFEQNVCALGQNR